MMQLSESYWMDQRRPDVNVSEEERKASVLVGALVMGMGLGNASLLRGLALAGIGAAVAYRGVTGHCHLYEMLNINSSDHDVGNGEENPDFGQPQQQPGSSATVAAETKDMGAISTVEETAPDAPPEEEEFARPTPGSGQTPIEHLEQH